VIDGTHIGYIQNTSFDNDTNKEFKTALLTLEKQGITSMIIDERNNPAAWSAPRWILLTS
jgi:carboxyl-terminal processing protease